MQFIRTKRWTSVRILRYVRYVQATDERVTDRVGTISLIPDVPEEIPASVAARMSPEERAETLMMLEDIRAKRPAVLLRFATEAATAAMREVAAAAAPGLSLRSEDADSLRAAVDEVAAAFPGTLAVTSEHDLVAGALEAVNALVDGIQDGLGVDHKRADELQMQLELIGNLLGEARASGSGAQLIPGTRAHDHQEATVNRGEPWPP